MAMTDDKKDDDGNGVTGDSMMGYDNDDDGDGRR